VVSARGRTRWLRWLGWREREPGNTAPEAIETGPNTDGGRPAGAIPHASAVPPGEGGTEPGAGSDQNALEQRGSEAGEGEDRLPIKPLTTRKPNRRKRQQRPRATKTPTDDQGGRHNASALHCLHSPETEGDRTEIGDSNSLEAQHSTAVRVDAGLGGASRSAAPPKTLLKAECIKEIAHADSLVAEMRKLVSSGQRVLEWAESQQTLQGGHLTLAAIRELRGTFETLAKIAAELKALEVTEALQDQQALEDEFNRCLDKVAERIRQSQAVQKPPADLPEPGGTVH
jgi:hypothetical protein